MRTRDAGSFQTLGAPIWPCACKVECMGGCRNYGPVLGTVNIRCRIIIGIQKGIMILTTTSILGYILRRLWYGNPR